MAATMAPEMELLRTKAHATWSCGDYGRIAESFRHGAAEFVGGLKLARGSRVLDVGCGTGNSAIPAAQAGACVIGVDFVASVLDQARARAKAAGLNVRFDIGDAEELSYPANSFDTVISMFGAMFTPRPEQVATEMLRVCRSGGRIVMANWTKEGFIGKMCGATAQYLPPPVTASPFLWGDEETVRRRLRVSDVRMRRRLMTIDHPFPPKDVVEHVRLYYGPAVRTFRSLEASERAALRHDLENLWIEYNEATGGHTRVKAEYLEVIATLG